jgi:hypothetical protein
MTLLLLASCTLRRGLAALVTFKVDQARAPASANPDELGQCAQGTEVAEPQGNQMRRHVWAEIEGSQWGIVLPWIDEQEFAPCNRLPLVVA